MKTNISFILNGVINKPGSNIIVVVDSKTQNSTGIDRGFTWLNEIFN